MHGRIGTQHVGRVAEQIEVRFRQGVARLDAREVLMVVQHREHVGVARHQRDRHEHVDEPGRARKQRPVMRIRIGAESRIERVEVNFLTLRLQIHGVSLPGRMSKQDAFLVLTSPRCARED